MPPPLSFDTPDTIDKFSVVADNQSAFIYICKILSSLVFISVLLIICIILIKFLIKESH